MRNWRVLTAIAAVVLAAITGVLIWQYLENADEEASEEFEQVDVLVAAENIGRGTTVERAFDQDLIKKEKRVRQGLPQSALEPGDEDRLAGLVFAADIAEDEVLVTRNFSRPGEALGTSLDIEDGMQAITINVDDTKGVAGFIKPNDRINVLATVEIEDSLSPEASDETAVTTAFLLPGLKVLAVGQTTSLGAQETVRSDTDGDGDIDEDDREETRSTAPQQVGLITLEVTPRQAEQVAHVTDVGKIYLSLNPEGFEIEDFENPAEIVESVNLFDQELTVLRPVLDALAQQQNASR